jgi:hypothetical protein
MTSVQASGGHTRSATPPWRRRLASIEAAALAGIVCAVGWSISLRGLLAAPPVDAHPSEIRRYYGNPDAGLNVLLLLQVMVIATLAFLWFLGVLRSRLGDRAPHLVVTVFFAGGILTAALAFVGTAALAAPAVLVEAGGRIPSADAASITRAMAVTILSVFTPRVATLVMISSASLGRKTGALPRWLVTVTYVVAAVELLNVTISEPTLYVFPAWVALVSLVLLVRRSTGRLDAAVVAPTRETAG